MIHNPIQDGIYIYNAMCRSISGMDNDVPGIMTPFDELVTTPELQIMKLIIPYAPASGRQVLAGMVKFMELKEALRLFSGQHSGLQAQAVSQDGPPDFIDILNSFRPYLKPREASMLDTIINVRQMMSVMERMQTAGNAEENGEFSDGCGASAHFNPAELLMGMLSPEQQEMFRTYQDLFSSPPDSAMKGDESDGQRMDEQSGNEEYGPRETGADTDGC